MKPTNERVPMQELRVEERIHSFKEVAKGYTEEEARAEADRCLQCKKLRCVEGCPVGIEICKVISLIKKGEYEEGIRLVRNANNLPAICGRVCPQETQCEGGCVVGVKGDPINIGGLERFLADWAREKGVITTPELPTVRRGRVAVVGSGPAGLTAAGDLAKMGYEVVIFEALHELGGVLTYGIPEFRLPKDIVQAEVGYIRKLGVRTEKNVIVGKTVTIDDLFAEGFDAMFVGTGAGLPSFLRVPGENLCGIYSANEFLIRVNLMRAYRFPCQSDTPVKIGSKAAVIGGGNVAMDSARCALRLGCEEVLVLYRRTEKEMPARIEEVRRAKEEGVKFEFLVQPIRFYGDTDGWVKRVECLRMSLGPPDESGRQSPIPVKGSEFLLDRDIVIVAIGQMPNPLIPKTTPGIETSEKHGTVMVNPETLETSRKGVFAGGDIVSGAATVIEAMEAGKIAAKSIDTSLSTKRR